MKNKKLLLFLSLLLIGIATYFLLLPKKPDFYLGGIQINEPDHNYWSERLKETGFNTVSVTHYAHQGIWNSDHLENPGLDEAVISEIKAAKANGLQVVLILRTSLSNLFPENTFLWHGMIMPKNDSLLNNWFEKYQDFVLMWAKKAEELDVDVLGIGSEIKELVATRPVDALALKREYFDFAEWQLKEKRLILRHQDELEQKHLWTKGSDQFDNVESFLTQKAKANLAWANSLCPDTSQATIDKINTKRKKVEKHWRKLIAATRKEYSGKLTYAANFDNYRRVGFWDALDFIGINAYFRLRNVGTDSVSHAEEMRQSWEKELKWITWFKYQNQLTNPIIFTELGFTYRENSTICPWAHDEFSVVEQNDTLSKLFIWYEQKKDYQERAVALAQLNEALRSFDPNLLKGALYWKLSTDSTHEQYEEFLVWIGEGTQDPMLPELNKLKEKKKRKEKSTPKEEDVDL